MNIIAIEPAPSNTNHGSVNTTECDKNQRELYVSLNPDWYDKHEKPGEGEAFSWLDFHNGFAPQRVEIGALIELCRHNVPLCNPFIQRSVEGYNTARNPQNFEQYSFFQEDIDEDFDLDRLRDDPFVQSYGTVILTSYHWQPNAPRGKVLYFLEEPITNINDAKLFARAIAWHRKKTSKIDNAVTDPLRLCFTCNPDTQHVELLGNLLPTSQVHSIVNEYLLYLTEAKLDARVRNAPTTAHNSGIDYYNSLSNYEAFPETYGYTPVSKGRWTRPSEGAGDKPTSGGLVLIERNGEKFYYSHSSNDPVCQVLESQGWEHPEYITPFRMMAALEYSGDFKEAYAKKVEHSYKKYVQRGRAEKIDLHHDSEGPMPIVLLKKSEETNAAYIERVLANLKIENREKSVSELLWWNGEEKAIFLGDDPLDEHLENLILAAFATRDKSPSRTDIKLRLEEIATRRTRHPIRDYLKGLEWDGIARIERFAETYLKDDDTVVEYSDGTVEFVRKVYFKKWLVGMAARVMTEGRWQNPVLILAGKQNMGKSSLVKWFASGIGEQYHVESSINPDNKDHQIQVSKTLFWEITELGATTKRRDMEALKGFLTTQKFTARNPYGKRTSQFTHLSSYIATVNPDGPFLNDHTGNRRFLTLNMQSIDWSYVCEDVDQLLAEAVHLYSEGYDCSLTDEEKSVSEDTNSLHNTENLIEDVIQRICILEVSSNHFTATSELVSALMQLTAFRATGKDQIQKELSQAMEKLDVKPGNRPVEVNGKKSKRRGYIGVKIDSDALRVLIAQEQSRSNQASPQ